MPNHIHGIIVLNAVGATLAVAQNENINSTMEIVSNKNQSQIKTGQLQGIAPTMNATVGDIVGACKSLVANACLEIFKTKNETMGKLWQRNLPRTHYPQRTNVSDHFQLHH